MPNYPLSRTEQFFGQIESATGTVPNSTGTATLAASNAFRANKLVMTPKRELYRPGYKTGSRSDFQFVQGRQAADWNMTADLLGSGAPGTAPDIDPILTSLFGGAGTATASTKYTYTLQDTIPSMSIWSFYPSGFNQRVGFGLICKEGTFNLGENIATFNVQGEGYYVLDSNYFSTAQTYEKGGLTAFPSAPTGVSYNGSSIVGFTGSAVIDGNTILDIRTANIKIDNANVLVKDNFGSFTPQGAEGDQRKVSLSFTAYDSDDAGTINIRNKAHTQTSVVVVLTIGTVSGNIYRFTMNKVVVAEPGYDEQRRRILTFNDCECFATTGTSRDEVRLECL